MTPRVLVAAHYASERLGGEGAIPLRLYRRLRARGVEAWLVTHDSGREELVPMFADEPDRLHLTSSLPGLAPVFTYGERLPGGPRVLAWGITQIERQVAMLRTIRRLVAELHVDVVHQPIGIAPGMPTPLRRLGAPLVVGPLNGGLSMPPAFRDREPGSVRFTQSLRRPVAAATHRLMPGRREAAVVLVANDRTRSLLPGGTGARIVDMPESAVVVADWETKKTPPAEQSGPIRFVYLGRLVALKSPDLALRAFARLGDRVDARFDILGDGPERDTLVRMADDLGVADRVEFVGWVDAAEASKRLRAADVFVYPSLREPGGTVVLEAMASGLPSIVADWGGPAEYVSDGTGLRVGIESPERFVDELTTAMLQLATDPMARAAMGAAARARVEARYDWDVLVDQLLAIYADLTGRHPPA
ncbi:MAG: glycosyltransferase family 4 protein [Actinomycetes bacterium]